jgi:hypothetical protein
MKHAISTLALSLATIAIGASSGCGGGGQVAKDERGFNVMEGQRLVEFRFKMRQAIDSQPDSDFAAERMEEVALGYNPVELRIFKEDFEAHWEKVKDDSSAHEDVKKYLQHAVEKIRGQELTWEPEKRAAARFPPGFGPNERQ